MRSSQLLILLPIAMTAAGCGSDITGVRGQTLGVNARADVSAPGSRTVPFKAHYDFRLVGVGPGPGCNARRFLAGEGTGTHLGNFTITLSFCGRPDRTLDTGTGTFVAANGDLLYITFHGVTDGGFPLLHFTSYVSFDGGTGRFVGATGEATVQGILDIPSGGGPADWDGTITFPGIE